ncbi:MAG: hypothetical protein LHW44_07160 [Candidatus Cloacimonetes bacterium]|nr:hypothetical protein [Candidatus Cloacimonadota bacterium]
MIIQMILLVIALGVMIYALIEIRKLRSDNQSLAEATDNIKVESSQNLEKVNKEILIIKEMAEDNKFMYQNYLIPAFRPSVIDSEIENFPVPGSSLAMVSFSDFVDSKNLELRKAQELQNADSMVKKMLRYAGVTNLPAAGVQIVAGIKNIANTNEFSVIFTKEAKAKLASGELRLMAKKGTNLFKANLVSNETNKVTNILDIAQKTKGQMASEVLANAASGVIAVAHIISNYDMSVQIKEISKKLDYLVEGRLIDKKARLKAIYYHFHHIMHLDSEQREFQLCLMHKELMELRYNWTMELEQELETISDDRNFFFKLLALGKESGDSRNIDKVCALEQKMLLIDGCFKIDSVVCGMTGIKVNVEHELEGVRRIRATLDRKYQEFKTDSIKMKTQKEMNLFFDMLESDCKTMFGNLSNNTIVESAYYEIE